MSLSRFLQLILLPNLPENAKKHLSKIFPSLKFPQNVKHLPKQDDVSHQISEWNAKIEDIFPVTSTPPQQDDVGFDETRDPDDATVSSSSTSASAEVYLESPDELNFSDLMNGKYSYLPLLNAPATKQTFFDAETIGQKKQTIIPPPLSPVELALGLRPIDPNLARTDMEKYLVNYASLKNPKRDVVNPSEHSTNSSKQNQNQSQNQDLALVFRKYYEQSFIFPRNIRLRFATQVQTLIRIALKPFSTILSALLPTNVVSSVHASYIPYTSLQFLSNTLGSAAGVVSIQALLTTIGLASSTAIPAAAALNWILKDVLGQIGGSLYATTLSTQFDVDPKHQRVLATSLYSVSSFLEVLTPLFPHLFLPLAAAGNVGKNVSWMSIAATKAAAHLSFMKMARNLADITVKSSAQATAAGVLGTSVGASLSLIYIPSTGSAEAGVTVANDPTIIQSLLESSPLLTAMFSGSFLASLCIFTVLSGLQLIAVHRSMGHVHVNTLNKQRLGLLLTELSHQVAAPATICLGDGNGVSKSNSKSKPFDPLSVEFTSLNEQYLRKFVGTSPNLVKINSNGNSHAVDANQLNVFFNLVLGFFISKLVHWKQQSKKGIKKVIRQMNKILAPIFKVQKSIKARLSRETRISSTNSNLNSNNSISIRTDRWNGKVSNSTNTLSMTPSPSNWLHIVTQRYVSRLSPNLSQQDQAATSPSEKSEEMSRISNGAPTSLISAELVRLLSPNPDDLPKIVQYSKAHNLSYYINLTLDGHTVAKYTSSNVSDHWLRDAMIRSIEQDECNNKTLQNHLDQVVPTHEHEHKHKHEPSTLSQQRFESILSSFRPMVQKLRKSSNVVSKLSTLQWRDLRLWTKNPSSLFQITTAYKDTITPSEEVLAYAHAFSIERMLMFDSNILRNVKHLGDKMLPETFDHNLLPQLDQRLELLSKNLFSQYANLLVEQSLERLDSLETSLAVQLEENPKFSVSKLGQDSSILRLLQDHNWDLQTVHLSDSKSRITLDHLYK